MKDKKLLFGILVLILLLSTTRMTISNNETSNIMKTSTTHSNASTNTEKEGEIASTEQNWKVREGINLVYNMTKLDYNGTPSIDVDDYYNQHVGVLRENQSFVFTPTYLPTMIDNDTEVWGRIGSATLEWEAEITYQFVPPNETLSNLTEGPPLLYFVAPVGNETDFNNTKTEFEQAGFTVTNNATIFGVEFQNTSITIKASWSKSNGVLIDWYFNGTEENNTKIEMHIILSLYFDPELYSPYWGMTNPLIAYNISRLEFSNGTTQMNVGEPFEEDNFGYLEEGQVALVSFEDLTFNEDGPSYNATMETATGRVSFPDPFGEDSNDGGPPFFVLIFPTSANESWWNDVGILFNALLGVEIHINDASRFGFKIQLNDTSLEIIWEKTTGILLKYNVTSLPFETRDNDTIVTLSFALDLIIRDDVANWTGFWGVSEGQIFLYHFDTIDIDGNKTIEAGEGYFKEGQNATLQIKNLPPNPFGNDTEPLSLLLSSLTGIANVSEGSIFPSFSKGPPLFIPVFPLEANGKAFNFLEAFYEAMGASITNDAQTFGVKFTNVEFEGFVYNLTASWNKQTGLIDYYKLEMKSLAPSGEDFFGNSFVLELTLIGETNEPLLPSSPTNTETTSISNTSQTTTAGGSEASVVTPGFDLVIFILGSITILIRYRHQKKTHQ